MISTIAIVIVTSIGFEYKNEINAKRVNQIGIFEGFMSEGNSGELHFVDKRAMDVNGEIEKNLIRGN